MKDRARRGRLRRDGGRAAGGCGRSRSRSATSTASTSDTPRCCAEARARAARRGGQSAVLTFTPHPARLFAPDRAPPLIMSLERRLELCAEAGIDIAIVEPFTREFAAIDAPAFVRDVLARAARRARRRRRLRLQLRPRPRRQRGRCCGTLGARGRHRRRRDPADRDRRRALLVDAHPRAGRGGRHDGGGDAARPSVRARGCRRARRRARARARLPDRKRRGGGRAAPEARASTRRARGCSTARWRARCAPPRSASARIPTFRCRANAVTVEAYLLDFEGDLYDRRLRVEVGERLRDERRFDSIDGADRADSGRRRAVRRLSS